MSVPEYYDTGAVKIPSVLDLARLEGKSVIVTGGDYYLLRLSAKLTNLQGQVVSERLM
jgi:hypothetical protein